MTYLIPKIYHIFNIDKNFIFTFSEYLSLKSLIDINNPDKIFIHYYYEFNDLNNKYIKKIIDNEKIILKKINVPDYFIKENNIDEYLTKNIKSLILFNLYNYGGILINFNMIFIKNINDLLQKYEYIETENNKIIMCSVNSKIIKKYMENNIKNEKNEVLISNYTDKYQYIYKNNYIEFNNNDLIKPIYDYLFSTYFHIINNCYFIEIPKINNNDFLNSLLNSSLIFSSIYSLLISYIFSYKFINNPIFNYEKSKYINNIDLIIWINLDRSKNRRENMNNILNNFNIINYRFSAFDGQNIDINQYFIKNNENIKDTKTKAEYATLLSHLSVIDLYCNNINCCKYNYALIMEDDISLEFMNYWKYDLKTIIENAPEFDILMLGYFSLEIFNNDEDNIKNNYCKWSEKEWSCMAYIINKNIKDKLNNLKNDGKWIYKENDIMVADNYIYSKFNTYFYKIPYFCNPTNNDSYIHNDHLEYHRIYKNNNYLTLENIYNKYINE